MKIKQIMYVVLGLVLPLNAAQGPTPSVQQAAQAPKQLLNDARSVAQLLFNPVVSGSQPVQQNPYATNSLNEAAIDATFGDKGMKLDKELVRYVKNFYFYLEYTVRVECAGRLAGLARDQKIDFVTTLEKDSWQKFVTSMITKSGSWQKLEDAFFAPTVKPDWEALRTSLSLGPWKDFPNSPFWQSMPITTETLIRSTVWQRFLKYSVTHSFEHDQNALPAIEKNQQKLFSYLPNLEVAYYDISFTRLRNESEMLHLTMLLTENVRDRWLTAIRDWATFKKAGQAKTAIYDMQKVYQASQEFKKTPYYRAATFGDDPAKAYQSVVQKKPPLSLQEAQADPHLIEQLLVLAMYKNLQSLLNFLTDKDHLEQTMATLANTQLKKPDPLIVFYRPVDYVYLDDLAHLNDEFQKAATQAKKSTAPDSVARVQNFFSDAWDSVKDTASDAWDKAKDIGEDAIQGLENAGKSVADKAKEVGFGTASQFIVSLGSEAANKLLEGAEVVKKKAQEEWDQAKSDLRNVVNDAMSLSLDTINLAQNAANTVSGLAGGLITTTCNLALQEGDKEFCDAAGKTFTEVVNMGVNLLAQQATEVVVITGGVIRLAADVVSSIARLTANLITGNYSSIGSDLLEGLRTMAEDAAASVLQVLTFELQFIMEQVISAFKLVSYLISMITRVFIDVVTAVTFIGSQLAAWMGAPINPTDIAGAVSSTLSAHERTIGTAITTGLLLATIPLTGGASTPLAIMGIVTIVGPQLFGVYGSYQEDEQKAQEQDDEQEFVDKYQKYVTNNEFVYQNQQNSFTNEIRAKYTAEVSNQERGLGFAENRMTNNFESIKEQVSLLLGNYWSDLLTPDSETKLIPADVGSIYGFTTNVFDLNPSQGFALYSAARGSFSQEIAAAPEILKIGQQEGKPLKSNNWFNQTQFYQTPQALGAAHVRLRTIYTLNSFYIGLYEGSKLNIDEIRSSKKAPLDPAYLAKMVVYHKESKDTPATVKLYEHEGKGWINSIQGPAFALGTWYHIKTQLSGTTLQVKIWAEPDVEPGSWQSFTVTQLAAQTIGVIASGAAIEYQILEPSITAQAQSMRPSNKYCALPCNADNPQYVSLPLEADREREAQRNFNFLLAPTQLSQNLSLKAFDTVDILKSNYVYTSTGTYLKANGTPAQDYCVLGRWEKYQGALSLIEGSLGEAPNATGSGERTAISLVTQKVYNTNKSGDGTQLNIYRTGVTQSYINARESLSPTLVTEVNAARTAYLKRMSSITFGQFKLQAANQKDLAENRYLYTMPLLGADGVVIKDKTGNPAGDFVICALLDGVYVANGAFGLDPDRVLNDKQYGHGLCSLVSGNIIDANKKTGTNPVVSSGFSPQQWLSNYQSSFGSLSSDILNAISASQKIYQQAGQQAATKQAPTSSAESKTTKSGDVTTATTKLTDAQLPPPPQVANSSLQQLSSDASGDDVSFG